jgi:hypothetical protein
MGVNRRYGEDLFFIAAHCFINYRKLFLAETEMFFFSRENGKIKRQLKVLSSEMDPAEIRLIRWDFFKGIVASWF